MVTVLNSCLEVYWRRLPPDIQTQLFADILGTVSYISKLDIGSGINNHVTYRILFCMMYDEASALNGLIS